MPLKWYKPRTNIRYLTVSFPPRRYHIIYRFLFLYFKMKLITIYIICPSSSAVPKTSNNGVDRMTWNSQIELLREIYNAMTCFPNLNDWFTLNIKKIIFKKTRRIIQNKGNFIFIKKGPIFHVILKIFLNFCTFKKFSWIECLVQMRMF